MKPCEFCGGEGPELAEAWNLEAGEFLIDACCEPALALANEAWADPQFQNELGVGYLLGSRVRRVHADLGLQPVIDCRLNLCAISQADAKCVLPAA